MYKYKFSPRGFSEPVYKYIQGQTVEGLKSPLEHIKAQLPANHFIQSFHPIISSNHFIQSFPKKGCCWIAAVVFA